MLNRNEFVIAAPSTVSVRIELQPTYNLLNSLLLLNYADIRSGLPEWVENTVRHMNGTTRTHNRVMGALFSAIEPDAQTAQLDFPAFIAQLEQLDPAAFPERYLNAMTLHHPKITRPETMLTDSAVFLQTIRTLYDDKQADDFDEALYTEVFSYLSHPPSLQQMLTTHLRQVWQTLLQLEWQRVQPMLRESISSFQQLNFTGLTALEAIRAVTGRDVSSIWSSEDQTQTMIFVPSAHIGPYLTRFGTDTTAIILFGARVPEGVPAQSSDLNRSDLLVQINALADDTRLQILSLLTRHDELCAQDIIGMLSLSQSSASRHLRQLTATGYLQERRRDVAKCYSLNFGRVQETTLALKLFLSKNQITEE